MTIVTFVAAGLLLGALGDHLAVRWGWKPALVLAALVGALAYSCLLIGDAEPAAVAFMVATYGSTQWVLRPLLRRRASAHS